jgi:hypothetical protein
MSLLVVMLPKTSTSSPTFWKCIENISFRAIILGQRREHIKLSMSTCIRITISVNSWNQVGSGENLVSFDGGGDRETFPRTSLQGAVRYSAAEGWHEGVVIEEKDFIPVQWKAVIGNLGSCNWGLWTKKVEGRCLIKGVGRNRGIGRWWEEDSIHPSPWSVELLLPNKHTSFFSQRNTLFLWSCQL